MYFFHNPIVFHNSRGDLKRYVGVEIEIEEFNDDYSDKLRRCLNKWSCSVVSDGSVGAFEINTSPARGAKFEDQINEICEVLNQANAKVDRNSDWYGSSHPCGVHVHIDARDYDTKDFFKMVKLWSKVEDKMFDKVATHRKDSHYCNRIGKEFVKKIDWKTNDLMLNSIAVANYLGVEADSIREIRENKDGGDRYHSMNFYSFLHRRTFENRMLEGTTDAKKIINWAKLNAAIVDYAKKTPMAKLKTVKNPSLNVFGIK